MKPADCKTLDMAKKMLKELGLGVGDSCILLYPPNVIIKHGCCKLTIPQKKFRKFAEWYLRDQED